MADDFPDILKALYKGLPPLLNGLTIDIDGTPTALAGITAGVVNPAALETAAIPGFIRVGTVDDPDNETSREAVVDVEFFSTSYHRGLAVSERIRGILRETRKINGVII